jgi:SPP1 gp7 family putative phage head morphogenesis protein
MAKTAFLFGPTPHEEAAAFIAAKPIVSREVFNALLPELRARAFVVAGIETASVLQDIRDTLATLPAGANWDDTKKELRAQLHPFLGDPADPDNTIAADRRAELLLRTHGFQAYQTASYGVMDRQRDAFPAWQYLSMQDQKVRPTHAALDGLVLPADSPFWDHHFPPWDWGCRCQVVPLSEADVAEIASEDLARPTEHQLIPTGVRRENIERHERMLKNGQNIDLRSPRSKGGSYQFAPKDLRLPIDQLRARYDAPVWGAFEEWAKKQVLPGTGTNVLAWLQGASVQQDTALPGVFDSVVDTIGTVVIPNPVPVRKRMREFLGRELTDQELVNISGAMDGGEVTVKNRDGHIHLSMDHPQFSATMYIRKGAQGPDIFWKSAYSKDPNNRQAGALPAMVRVLRQARQLGIERLSTTGASGHYVETDGSIHRHTGFKTWPKLGFEGPIPKQLQKLFPGKHDIKEVFADPVSKAIWVKEADTGDAWDMFLDLKDGSTGLPVIQEKLEYQARRENRKTTFDTTP